MLISPVLLGPGLQPGVISEDSDTASFLPVVMRDGGAPTPTQSPFYLGVHTSIWEWDHISLEQIALAALSGAEAVRLPISWYLLQPTSSTKTETWYLAILSDFVEAASQQNLKLIFMMEDPPAWAVDRSVDGCSDGRHHYCPLVDPQDYADAVRIILDNFDQPSYGGTVIAFEVWNEPNYRADTQDIALTPEQYVAILSATYATVKPNHPDILIFGGALEGTDVAYLVEMFQRGLAGNFDRFSIHPYPYGDTRPPEDCTHIDASYLCGIPAIREVLVENNHTGPIWLTEIGWSSYSGTGGVGADLQRSYLARALQMIHDHDWTFVEGVVWYNLVDCTELPRGDCAPLPADQFHYYGLYDKERAPKAVLDAFVHWPDISPPQLVDTIHVSSNAHNGVELPTQEDGTYLLKIRSGVYSPWPENTGQDEQWRSIIYLYKNREIEWVQREWGSEPGFPDFQVGYWEIPGETRDEAELRALDSTTGMVLEGGDLLRLIGVDVQSSYGDNRGDVVIDVYRFAN